MINVNNKCFLEKLYFLRILNIFLFAGTIYAQNGYVESRVYSIINMESDKNIAGIILDGETTSLEKIQLFLYSADRGSIVDVSKFKSDYEKLFLIKEGELKIRIGDEEKTVGPGSIALLYPGEYYTVESSGQNDAVFYLMQYISKVQPIRAKEAKIGKSFILDWKDLEFVPHDKGGIRRYFEKSTFMLDRFEMHVTTLNKNIKSHEPHTHKSEEIVLMIEGTSSMQIGESFYDASKGDLFFLGSNVAHAIKNTGNESCMYFAFQWE